MNKLILACSMVLFLTALSISIESSTSAIACCNPQTCNLVLAANPVVSGTSFTYDLAQEWCYPDPPFMGWCETTDTSTDNVVDGSVTYTPAYHFPTFCINVISIEVNGTKVTSGVAASVKTTGKMWDSGSPPLSCQKDYTASIP